LRIKQQRSGNAEETGSHRRLDILYDLDAELFLKSERRRAKSALRDRKKNFGNHNNNQNAHEYHRRQLNELLVEEDLLFWERELSMSSSM
jgi:hypothetical protein